MSRLNSNTIRAFVCLLAGALTPLAFAPWHLYPVSIITSALLFYIWTGDSPAAAFRHGYLFGLGLFGTGVSWLHISINLFGGVNLAGSLFITLVLVAYLALYPAACGYLARRLFPASATVSLTLIFPALWVLTEYCRAGMLYMGFSWLQLGYSQTASPLGAMAPLAGVYGVTLVMLLCSALLVVFITGAKRSRITAIIMILSLWGGAAGLGEISWSKARQDDIRVALIQGAIPQEQKWQPDQLQPSLKHYLDLTAPYWGYDLVIWPETAIPAFYHQVKEFMSDLYTAGRSNGTTLLVGMPVLDSESSDYYNSIVRLDEEVTIYHKRHLVPFGEYLPLDTLLRPLLDFLEIPMSDFSTGSQPTSLLAGNKINIGASICYEDTFGDEVIDALPVANVLVNISNDAWFGDSLSPHQHLQMAQMRARESGRYMLRATNTGITAIINEQGEIIARSRQFQPDTVAGVIRLFDGATPYARFRDLPTILLAVILLFIVRYKTSGADKPRG